MIAADGPKGSEHFKMVVKRGNVNIHARVTWMSIIYTIVAKVCGELWTCN